MDCTISADDFMELVKARLRDYWKINLEDYKDYLDQLAIYIEEYGNEGHDVMYITDNFYVNGDYGSFDEYREDEDTDESFQDWLDQNTCWYDLDKKICIVHFGI